MNPYYFSDPVTFPVAEVDIFGFQWNVNNNYWMICYEILKQTFLLPVFSLNARLVFLLYNKTLKSFIRQKPSLSLLYITQQTQWPTACVVVLIPAD